MPAKKPSFLRLPVEVYWLTAEDKERAREEVARGMVAPQYPVLDKAAAAVTPNEIQHWPRACTLARWEELKRLTPTR